MPLDPNKTERRPGNSFVNIHLSISSGLRVRAFLWASIHLGLMLLHTNYFLFPRENILHLWDLFSTQPPRRQSALADTQN